MASTIQVDTIKDIGGNTIISSNGSGTFTSNLPASGATLTGSTNNQVVTVTGANAITGEANLIFDGTTLTKPLQPGFSATKSTSAQAVNAAYVSVNFNNEIWDNNADWNGSTTFTAPVTGKYMFTGAMRIDSILAQGGSVFGRINTSNRPYVFGNITDADDVFNATTAQYQFQGAVVADMDASDTATLDFFSNFATTIAADGERVWFQGYLLG